MVADAEVVRDRESRIRRYVADLRDLAGISLSMASWPKISEGWHGSGIGSCTSTARSTCERSTESFLQDRLTDFDRYLSAIERYLSRQP